MELRQLAYFVAVAEEGQFTRAAARASVAQPAVSAQIARLEAELGEPLFHRDQRGAVLTETGRALLPHARSALAAVEHGHQAIAGLRGLLSGRLRIGVSKPLDRQVVDALGAFHRAHPAVEIVLREQHNQPLIDAVARGDLDAAVVGLPAGSPPAGVRARVFSVEPLVVAVGHDDPLGRRTTITLGQLRERPMLTLVRGSGLRAVLESACARAGFPLRVAAESGELDSLVQLAAQGLGVAILPRSATAQAEVAVLELTRPRLRRHAAIVWNPDGAGPAGRAFIVHAKRRLPPVGDG